MELLEEPQIEALPTKPEAGTLSAELEQGYVPDGMTLTPAQEEAMRLDAIALFGDTRQANAVVTGESTVDDAAALREQALSKYSLEVYQKDTGNIIADPSTTPAQKAQFLKELDPNPKAPAMERAFMSLEDMEMADAKVRADTTRGRLQIKALIEQGMTDQWEANDKLDVTLDFLGSIVPVAWGINVHQASKAVHSTLGQDQPLNVLGILAVGEAKKRFVDAFQKASYEEQLKVIEAIDEWAYNKSGTISDENSIMAMEIRGALLDYTLGERVLDDVIGVVDIVTLGVASKLKAMWKGGERVAASLRTIGKPTETVDELMHTSIGNTDEVVALKTEKIASKLESGEDVTDDVLTILNMRPLDDAIENATMIGTRPELVKRLKDMRDRQSAIVTGDLNAAKILTDEERVAKQESLLKAYSNIPDVDVHSIRFTSPKDTKGIAGTQKSVTLEAIYGPNTGGYMSLIEAQKAAKLFPADVRANAKPVIYDAADGTWHDVGTEWASLTKPSFYLKYNATHNYDVQKDIIADTFGVNGMFQDDVWIKGTGYLTSYMKDNGNRLKAHVMDMLNVSSDTRFVLRNRMREQLMPMNNLKPASQGKVFQVLEEGSKEEKTYSVGELLARHPDITDEEIEGYYAVRSVMDISDTFKNAQARAALERDGFSHYHTDSGVNTLAHKLEHQPTLSEIHNTVWDAERNVVRKLTQQELDELYANGGHIATLHKPERVGAVKMDHLLVKDARARKDLPARVINYREGYIHRYYKEKWYVDVSESIHYRGKKVSAGETGAHTRTVAAYSSKEEALAHKFDAETQAKIDAGDMVVTKPRLDERLGLTDEGEIDTLRTEGRLFTSKRGERLSGSDVEDNARIEDILTSVESDVNNVSALVAHADVAANLRARVRAHYVDDFDPVTGKIKVNASKEAQEAQGVLDWYNGVPVLSDKIAMAGLVRFSNWLEGKGAKKASQFVFDRSGSSPAQAVRSVTYGTFIAMNPAKQLLLQGSQFLMLAGAHPIKAAQALRQVSSFHLAYLLRNHKNYGRYEKSLATGAGVSVDEFRAMSQALHDSGLIQSLANHSVIQATDVFKSKSGATGGMSLAAQRASNAIKLPFNVAQKAGFQAGEAHNLTMTWLMAHNLWKDANKGVKWAGDRALYGEWGAKARQWTLNANTMGSFKFQKGILATTTQFWAFQIKAWEAILTSKAFSKKEKAGMFAGLATMWGTTGVFAQGMWEKVEAATGNSIDQDIRNYIENGVLDQLLNDLATAMGGTDANGAEAAISFSESMSPLGGIGLVIDAFSRDDGNVFDMLGGVSSYAYSTYKNSYQFAGAVWEDPSMDTPEQITATIGRAMTVFPVISNIQRGRLASRILRNINKSSLKEGEKITMAEAFMLGATGFMSRKQIHDYEMKSNEREIIQDAEDQGRNMAHHFNSKFSEVFNQYGLIPEAKWKEVEEYLNAMQMYASREERRAMKRGFNKYFIGNPESRREANRFLSTTAHTMADRDTAIQHLMADPRFTTEKKEQIRTITEHLFDNEELARGAPNDG